VGDITVLLVALAALAIMLRLNFVFYLLYVGVGTYALVRWWTGRNMAGLRVQRRYSDHLFLGQDTQVDIEITNTRWWPVPWLRCDETVPVNLLAGPPVRQVLALQPKQRLHIRYQITGRKRGYYPVGPLRLSTGDLFGFAETQAQVLTEDYLFIYPRVVPLAGVNLRSRAPYGTVSSQQRIFADPTRVGGKREYQPGDPLRSIDWKSSAHSAGLQVKKYDPAVSLASVIFLNLRVNEYSRQLRTQASEWAIVAAASLANYLVGQRQPVGLASNGIDAFSGAQDWLIPPRAGRPHLMKLLESLARVQAREIETTFAKWLPTAALDLAWGTLAIVVTPVGDEATCQALHRLVRAGLNPVLMVVEPQAGLGQLAERARLLGFTAALAADERDLANL
jgi:uncharacterized protein (DUF58 family)